VSGSANRSPRRQTLARSVTLEGIGLHMGRQARITFHPAPEGRGIVFRRVDLPGAPEIPALVGHTVLTERRTQLTGARTDAEMHTVEHVLAAVLSAELDDVLIDVEGPEPPALDGSAGPFFDAIMAAGLAPGHQAADYLELTEPIRVIDGDSVYEASPAPDLELDVTVDFAHPLIGRQHGVYRVTPALFGRELAGARTFGFLHEQESLRAKGLIQGASTENAVVLTDTGVLNGGLRWSDEFVRHKAMDCVGDLALAGCRVRARVTAFRPSHRGTVTLVREMVRAAGRPVDVGTNANVAGAAGMASGDGKRAGGPVVRGATEGRQETRMVDATKDAKHKTKSGLTIDQLINVIPHRYPFLLVDRILEIDEKKRIVGLKNVTINEPYFQGHFPGHPIMPGVLIIEAMAQVGGVLLMGAVDDHASKVVYFMSLDNVKFRRPVKPGDQLIFELEITQIRGTVCKMRGVAKVDGDVVAEADMAAMVRDR
jgi:UDP-3-O-[3-hydroxymyristoyl] N-acetylglucosamine deacetylase / 3-hydroxyacyl-[acyl-carrier-protein] dehydratase